MLSGTFLFDDAPEKLWSELDSLMLLMRRRASSYGGSIEEFEVEDLAADIQAL